MIDAFQKFWDAVMRGVSQFQTYDIIDILIITIIIYKILMLTKETRAVQVLKGLGVILLLSRVTEALRLQAVSWMLNYIINAGAIVMVIVFQPELRRALEQIGRGRLFTSNGSSRPTQESQDLSWAGEEIARAILNMAKNSVGALIVLTRRTGLVDVMETGTKLDAVVSQSLIENIFMHGTPLHDGAVVMQGARIGAAGCFLPMTTKTDLPNTLGTRHRAALGLSETSDAIVLVVSEENGTISVARDGKLTRNLEAKQVRSLLERIYGRPASPVSLTEWLRRKKVRSE